ncbi:MULTISPECIES: ribose-phosphate diphosphokinase [Bifidobacterium]|uniref:Ribose-phosphate pyrophosphokinase n=1 Tax=Bifidobacterium tibiigranuli TaxID=2172043 RepID=A0A5N6RVM1_9BIFI|nr:ribose-phosphate diphosphokinase [Bifidobacterium tibiigranuli]KAE8126445.1 ribose-phosphate diphosphokinase [Bifidobacterium tibiigranuli]KAE8126488.1 ribose-phosphate diphosphokinase [Bifidobacterium tibiigranuli]MCH3974352.1 ribose-phosphate diphosphokinase [Bifidobacterium tibiigranuli]MCH4188915.1 ribose-phosphate diphosphokinase [Bifidobacterium tibiigranuli]MCH4203180.1 ribose-phosphate diphosphokinase [Bifidobacterium tibiigranuli]
MSAILAGKPDKNLILVTGRAHPKLAADVASQLGIDVLETTAYDFANGEMYVRYTESVRGADVFVLQSHANPVNKSIMEQLIMIDALKRASARSITAVCPLLGYSRQDKKHLGREPISCRLVFDLLKTAGADRIMSVDLHAAQSQGFFDGPVDHLIAMPVLVDYIRDRFADKLDNVTVVSPDAGRIRVAEQWAQRLGGGPLAFVHKTRDITRPNQAVAHRIVGDVEGKDCVLVDDLIDTAGTIAGACSVLKESGAHSVTVVATHGVFSGPAIERLKESGAREVVVTDTVPIDDSKRWDGLTVLSIAPLLASAIRAVFEDGSVAELFDTYPEHHGQGFLFA